MKLRFQNHYDKPTTLEVEKLGQGMFTKAYKVLSEVYLLTCDPMKEIYTIITGTHLPVTEKIGYQGEKEVYRSVLYQPLTKEHTAAWGHFRELKRLLGDSRGTYVRYVEEDKIESLSIPNQMKHDLINLFNWALNYDYNSFFEVSPRNLKVDSDGNLILLDVVVSLTTLRQVRGSR
jgi:hypothetical protein